MVFSRQNPDGKFVAWGEEKAKENSFVVKAGSFIEGVVTEIKESDMYGHVFTLKSKESAESLIVTSTTVLLKELGYERDDVTKALLPDSEQSIIKGGGKKVVVGDVVRIHFDGMVKTKRGKDAYKLWVEVDRPEVKL